MNEVQAAAIALADKKMKPALDLYEQRCYLWRLTCFLALPELIALNSLLARLTPDQLRRTALFAEGLAEWNAGEQQSPDAQG